MKPVVSAIFVAALAVALSPIIASAAVVTNKKTCTQAVSDAREGLANASISRETRADVDDMIRISEHLCGEANFVYAETLLGIARGMTAEE